MLGDCSVATFVLLNEGSSFGASFLKETLVLEQFENFRDFKDRQINQHTSDLGSHSFSGILLNLREQEFTQNLSLLFLIQLQEFGHLALQTLNSNGRGWSSRLLRVLGV